MKLFTRTPVDPIDAAAIAQARAAAVHAEVERARLMAQLDREQRAADREDRQRREAEKLAEKATRRERRRAGRSRGLAKLRPVIPLLLINGGAAYSQAAYAYAEIAPPDWNVASKLAFAVSFSAALESISIYVQWHAHDALMQKAHATAARLRRASWTIAAIVAAINYAHFAGAHLAPNAAAVAFGLLSLLSPWLWGLHTRRAQHVQLLAEDPDQIDDGGAEFSPERRRAFPIRSWMARRWSIDHNVRDPKLAWAGYKSERQERRDARATARAGRPRTAWPKLRRAAPAPSIETHESEPAAPVADGTIPASVEPARPLEIGAEGDAPEESVTTGQRVRHDERTPDDVAETIRALRAANQDWSQRRIGVAVGRSESTVRRVLGPEKNAPVSAPPAIDGAPESVPRELVTQS